MTQKSRPGQGSHNSERKAKDGKNHEKMDGMALRRPGGCGMRSARIRVRGRGRLERATDGSLCVWARDGLRASGRRAAPCVLAILRILSLKGLIGVRGCLDEKVVLLVNKQFRHGAPSEARQN